MTTYTAQEQRMMEQLEEARLHSMETDNPVYAMGNGKTIAYTTGMMATAALESMGYWVVSIFIHGHRTEI